MNWTQITCLAVSHFNHHTKLFYVPVWGWNLIISMLGWFCSICLIHLIEQKSLHFENKTRTFNGNYQLGTFHSSPKQHHIMLVYSNMNHYENPKQLENLLKPHFNDYYMWRNDIDTNINDKSPKLTYKHIKHINTKKTFSLSTRRDLSLSIHISFDLTAEKETFTFEFPCVTTGN